MRASLEEIAEGSFQSKVHNLLQSIASLEGRKSSLENSIEQLKQNMAATTGGAAMGCLGFFLFFFVAIIFAATVLSDTPERNRVQGGLVFSVWGVGIVGALVGRWISRDNKNRPKRLEIEDHSEKINECIRTVPGHDGLGRCV